METELRVFKNGNGQAISIKQELMKQMNLNVGDKVIARYENEKLILKKKERESFEERWNRFRKEGGTYEAYQVEDWGEPAGRESW